MKIILLTFALLTSISAFSKQENRHIEVDKNECLNQAKLISVQRRGISEYRGDFLNSSGETITYQMSKLAANDIITVRALHNSYFKKVVVHLNINESTDELDSAELAGPLTKSFCQSDLFDSDSVQAL